jgi:enoyl-CoA hydratase/carnithine racemase
MMSRAELVDAEQALAWGLADSVIRDGPDGEDLRAFVRPIAACAPQVLRGIKAQAMAARGGASWTAHRQVEREHFVRTWLHVDHWAAADKLLSKGT